MELHLKKNAAAEIMFPMVDSSAPESLKSGLSPTDDAYYKDGAGSWTALSISDTATEIGSTGLYTIEVAQAEMNHDLIMIKMTGSGAADSVIVVRTFANNIDDVKTDTAAILVDTGEIGTAGVGLTNLGDTRLANLDATVSSRLEPAGTLATVTNLTNAPTAGDFTATMKTSLDAATPASVVGAVGSVTGNVGGNVTGSIGSLAAQAKTDVNAEVADVIGVDANTELASIPSTTSDLRKMVQFIFQYFRNKRTVSTDTETMYKEDASTPVGTATLSDDGTFTKGEMG